MSSVGFGGEQGQAWVTQVAEAAIQPSYVSEIARNLISVGLWDTTLTNGIKRASIAIEEFIEDHRESDYQIDLIGAGQVEGSPHYQLGQPPDSFDGVSETSEWKPYKLFWNKSTSVDDVINTEILDVINPDMTFEEKKEQISKISGGGKENALNAELILQDQLPVEFFNHTPRTHIIEKINTGFNNPGIDSFIIGENREMKERGFAFEVSTRWVNSIDSPYVKSKRDEAIDMESEYDVEVDSVIMGPKFAKNFNSDIVTQAIVPRPLPGNHGKITGTPVIIADPPEKQELFKGTPSVGEDYPIVTSRYERYRESLSDVGRSVRKVEELDYRTAIGVVVTQVLSNAP